MLATASGFFTWVWGWNWYQAYTANTQTHRVNLHGHVLYFVMGSHVAQAGPELALGCSEGQGRQTPPLAEELSPYRGEHSFCILTL